MIRSSLSLAFAAGLCLATLSPSAAAAESSILYNQQTTLCAYPIGGAADAYLHQTACTGAADQLWAGELVARLSSGTTYMRLRNKATNLCADLETASTVNGIRIVQRTCNSSTTQQWSTPVTIVGSIPTAVGPTVQGNQNLINRFSGRCLEAPADTTPLRQNTCGSGGPLRWFFAL
jgi:hypothetical protein